jgi:hypothetical protein
MKQFRVTIEAVITLPEGTNVPERGRAFVLPSGDWVKPWIVLEMNDGRDLTYGEAAKLGCFVMETNNELVELVEEVTE